MITASGEGGNEPPSPDVHLPFTWHPGQKAASARRQGRAVTTLSVVVP
ncbi:hypothetical protein SAURM35S_08769 [Streptomyces aurantiogriseus]